MSASPHDFRQPLVAAWLAPLIGTVVLAGVVLYFVRSIGAPFADGDSVWRQWATAGILLGSAPALLYIGTFKARLDADAATIRLRGAPDPALRKLVLKSLAIGGALCEIPMAMGVVQLLLGGETRWFLGATLITIALRLSYRPFTRKA